MKVSEALSQASAELGQDLVTSCPLDLLKTSQDLEKYVPKGERDNFMWLLLKCKDPEITQHHRKILGIWNAENFPKEAHELLRVLTKGCSWAFFTNFRHWHSHFLLQTNELEMKLESLLNDRTMENVASLRLLIGLCVPYDGGERVWPTWLVQYLKPFGEDVLDLLSRSAAKGEAADDIENWTTASAHPLRIFALPGRATVETRSYMIQGSYTGDFFQEYGLPQSQRFDSSFITNHEQANAIINCCPDGGAFDCKLNNSFPNGKRGQVTCDATQIVYSDILATGTLVKEYLDKRFGKMLQSTFPIASAPRKDAMRLIAKGKENSKDDNQSGMTNIKDCVRYSVTVDSMRNTAEVIDIIKSKLGENGWLVEVKNKMQSKFKAVFVIFAVSLEKLAGKYPFFSESNHEVDPSHVFLFEVQISTATYGILNKYSHVLFEVSREKGPGKAFHDLQTSLRPLLE